MVTAGEFPRLAETHHQRTLRCSNFFSLSGFLITKLLLKERDKAGTLSLRGFYVRRAFRILPAFLALIAVFAILDLVTDLNITATGYITCITFTKSFLPEQWTDGHLWSLSVEEQFYLMWPLAMAFLSFNGRWKVTLAVIAICPLLRVISYTNYCGPQISVIAAGMSTYDSLMIGCLGALLIHRFPRQSIRLLQIYPALLRAAACIAIVLIWQLQATFRLGVFLVPLATTIQCLASTYLIASYSTVKTGLLFRALNLSVVDWIGRLSYSLYLWQQLFLGPDGVFFSSHPWYLRFPSNLFAAFLVAIFSYHVLEKPFLRLKDRLFV